MPSTPENGDFPMLDGPAFRRFEQHVRESIEDAKAEPWSDPSRRPLPTDWVSLGSTDEGFSESWDVPVRKYGVTFLLSEDVAMDAGIIPDTRDARPDDPVEVTAWWLRRLGRWASRRWYKLRQDVGFKIAGEDPRDHECPYI